MNKNLYWTTIQWDEWEMLLAATEEGLCYLSTPQEGVSELQTWALKHLPNYTLQENEQRLTEVKNVLYAYLQGTIEQINLTPLLYGTAFQQSVWEELLKVPYGQTVTYSDIAERIGKPKAVRAVGTAIGANRILLIVPCHRIIGKNGSLTGFRGGIEMKEWLLQLETSMKKTVQ